MTLSALGPYRIDRELGSGGMAHVYAAVVEGRVPGLEPGAEVAIKVVHAHLLHTPGFFQRFLREAQLGRAIRHDNVVRTLDCDQAIADGQSQCFLVMEYVEGQTLAELLEELDHVPEELCRHIAREICRGLAAIHDAGVVHRDIKPANVLITPDHHVKVMDLGVARLADEAIRLSRSGAFVGSVEYAAPEQFSGAEIDGRTDLHALGVLLYELSSGTHPYRSADFHSALRRVCSEEPRRLGDVNPQLSAFFEEVVHTLLVKDPRGRFASAADLLSALTEGEDSSWWHARAHEIQVTTRCPLRRIRVPRETAVYGREHDLARLTELFDRVKSGDGQVVLIEGEAGIGKSRLIDELIGRLHAGGEKLHFLFGAYPPGGAASAAAAFTTAFHEQFGDDGAAAHLTQTPMLLPAFEAALRGDIAPSGAPPLTMESLATCLIQAARGLATKSPTVVLIDDLHFAPEQALGLFSALAMALAEHRVLLIGAMRPGVEGPWRGNLQRFGHVSQIQVARLTTAQLAELLEDSFRSEHLAMSLADKIATKSDGNPFFAFEIIRGLREGQFVTQKQSGTWVGSRAIDEIQIPSSVLDLVNARVAELSEDERDLLEVAACCGFAFDPMLVAEVCGLAAIPALKRFGRIEKRHRLIRSTGRSCAFDHHQVHDALYLDLHETLREQYHAQIADALEARTGSEQKDPETLSGVLCVDLCEHYFKGARGEAALRYLPAAEAHLIRSYQLSRAAALTERALAVPGLLTGMERAHVLLRLAQDQGPLAKMGRRPRQEECLLEAESLAAAPGDDKFRFRTATELGNCLKSTSRCAEAEAAFRRALDIAHAAEDQQLEAAATGSLGTIRELEGHTAEAQRLYERAGELFEASGDQRGVATVIGRLGIISFAEGRLGEARAHHERHLAISRETGDRDSEARATGNLGSVLRNEGRLPKARAHLERYLALSRQVGYRAGEIIALHNLGGVLGELNETALAEERLLAGLSLSQEIGHRMAVASTHVSLGSMYADAGDESAAWAYLETARELASEIGAANVDLVARCHLACLPGGDVADALAVFAERHQHLVAEELRLARWLLFRATGDRAHLEEAKRLLDETLEHVDEAARASILSNLPVNREIMAAWSGDESATGTDVVVPPPSPDSGSAASPGDAPTRIA